MATSTTNILRAISRSFCGKHSTSSKTLEQCLTTQIFLPFRCRGFMTLSHTAKLCTLAENSKKAATFTRGGLQIQYRHRDINCRRFLSTSGSLQKDNNIVEKSTQARDTQALGSLERRLAIQFTCKVCNHRQTKTFTKHPYEKGIVIVQCDGCENNHLIADNLSWFSHVKGR